MGQTVQLPQTGEKLFIPRYRVTFRNMFGTERTITVDGNERLHKYDTVKEQVRQAVSQAEVLYALDNNGLNMGQKVVKVEREWESEKGWDELTRADLAAPGTKITIWSTSCVSDGHGVRPYFANIVVGRWHGLGDGTAALIDDKGKHCGIYSRDDIFTLW
jgi:hypothetical protein